MYQIEKNIPAPKPNNRGRRLKYPYDKMEIGDSFFVPLNGHKSLVHIQQILSKSARQYGKKHETRYATSCQGDGVRVWRIS